MSKILKLIASIFLVAAFCLAFTADNYSEAATNKNTKATAEEKKALQLFRQSLLATVNDNKKIFHQFFLFTVPDFQGELEFNGKVTGHSLEVAGALGIWISGANGKVSDFDVPFYITQNQNNMEFYYNTDKQWKKYIAPIVAAKMTDVITSPTREELEKQVAMVKNVQVLQENDSRRTLLVRLDGNKLADEFAEELKNQAAKNPSDKGTAQEDAIQSKIFNYIDTGIRRADLWYTWKIDKKNNQTGAIIFDLSPIIQEIARAALDDPENDDLPDELREILETLAFFSEFRAYTSFLGPEAESSLAVPQDVINSAKLDEDLVKPENIPAK